MLIFITTYVLKHIFIIVSNIICKFAIADLPAEAWSWVQRDEVCVNIFKKAFIRADS